MKAEIKRKVCGKLRTFAMPLAAVEEVSKVNDMPRQLGIALASGYGKREEILAVVEAGATHGDTGLTVEEIYADLGLAGMEKLAVDLWLAAWGDDSGNSLAAGKGRSARSASGAG
jgi:hypothetical protein